MPKQELTPPDYPFALDVEALWAAAVPARVAGVEILAFSPEDLLMHLGLHATIHRFAFGLRPLSALSFPAKPGALPPTRTPPP